MIGFYVLPKRFSILTAIQFLLVYAGLRIDIYVLLAGTCINNVLGEVYEDDYEEWSLEENLVYTFDEDSLADFVESYRDYYQIVLPNDDFYFVSDLLSDDSEIYHGISDYINEISGEGMIFEFVEHHTTSVDIYEEYALVHRYESFNFMNAAGEWTVEELKKTYTIVLDESVWHA